MARAAKHSLLLCHAASNQRSNQVQRVNLTDWSWALLCKAHSCAPLSPEQAKGAVAPHPPHQPHLDLRSSIRSVAKRAALSTTASPAP